MRELARNASLTPDYLNIESAKISADAKKILKAVNTLYDQVEAIDIDQYNGEEKLWSRLEELTRLVQLKLRILGRRKDQ